MVLENFRYFFIFGLLIRRDEPDNDLYDPAVENVSKRLPVCSNFVRHPFHQKPFLKFKKKVSPIIWIYANSYSLWYRQRMLFATFIQIRHSKVYIKVRYLSTSYMSIQDWPMCLKKGSRLSCLIFQTNNESLHTMFKHFLS